MPEQGSSKHTSCGPRTLKLKPNKDKKEGRQAKVAMDVLAKTLKSADRRTDAGVNSTPHLLSERQGALPWGAGGGGAELGPESL